MADEQTGQPATTPARGRAARKGRRPSTSPATARPGKVAKQIKVPHHVHVKLEIWATMEGTTVSEIIVGLVNAAPTKYVVHRGPGADAQHETAPALGVVSAVG